MSLPKYTVVSGYHERSEMQRWFFRLWWRTLRRSVGEAPAIVLATGDSLPHPRDDYDQPQFVALTGDLGHCGQIISGEKDYHFSGGTAGVLALLMLAYCNETSAIYVEQDLLAFGPFVEKMYEEIGDKGCIFGNCRQMGSTQSLMLVRHWFIPKLVHLYLGTGHEKERENVGESKFSRLEAQYPEYFCRYSFGSDRDRPIPYDDPVFFAQKLTCAELRELEKRGLVDLRDMPEIEGVFSNDPGNTFVPANAS